MVNIEATEATLIGLCFAASVMAKDPWCSIGWFGMIFVTHFAFKYW